MHHIFTFISRYFLWILIVVALALLALAFEGGRYTVYRAHPELSGVEQQANEVLKKVGSLIQLPSGETPTMATINDAASAKKAQPFLANALNGDILIVYQNAAEALLYRPSTNKLIAVGPVNNTAESSQVSLPAPEPTPQANDATSTKSKR
ncbi:MAG: hypothetical protein WC887_01555 [Candidatus Paceibacterota bacterium]|jgi:hypothetical protein